MSTLKFEIENAQSHFQPGSQIRGRAAWHLEQAPEAVEMRLLWHTEGKGTRDVNVAESIELQGEGTWGDCEFVLNVPEGPYSFSGKLVSLVWAVEIVAEPSNESFAEIITIGVADGEITLHKGTLA